MRLVDYDTNSPQILDFCERRGRIPFTVGGYSQRREVGAGRSVGERRRQFHGLFGFSKGVNREISRVVEIPLGGDDLAGPWRNLDLGPEADVPAEDDKKGSSPSVE